MSFSTTKNTLKSVSLSVYQGILNLDQIWLIYEDNMSVLQKCHFFLSQCVTSLIWTLDFYVHVTGNKLFFCLILFIFLLYTSCPSFILFFVENFKQKSWGVYKWRQKKTLETFGPSPFQLVFFIIGPFSSLSSHPVSYFLCPFWTYCSIMRNIYIVFKNMQIVK